MGDSRFLQGAWCSNFEELTGCVHRLRYGCYDLPEETLRLEGEGSDLYLWTTTTVGEEHARAFLPIEARRAEVLARDNLGGAALTRMRHGEGEVLFLAYPWERYLAEQHAGVGNGTAFELYRLLAARAGLAPTVRASDPGVQLRLVEVEGEERPLLWVLNHRWEPAYVTLDTPGGEAVFGLEDPLPEGSQPLELGPKEVAVYRLARAP